MSTTIQIRRDYSYNWTRINPVLKSGEPGFAFDTNILKIGDGVAHWEDLDEILPETDLYNEIMTALEPTVDLVILFENALV